MSNITENQTVHEHRTVHSKTSCRTMIIMASWQNALTNNHLSEMKEESANLFRTCAQFDTSLDRTIYKGLNTHKRLCTHLHFAQYIEASFAPLALFQNKEEGY